MDRGDINARNQTDALCDAPLCKTEPRGRLHVSNQQSIQSGQAADIAFNSNDSHFNVLQLTSGSERNAALISNNWLV